VSPRQDREEIRGIGESFGRIVSGRTVLWVDDNPDNNTLERAALESLGIGVTTATRTEEALDILRARRLDLVISDWVRGVTRAKGPSEGLRLLTSMRAAHVFTPFLVYCGWLPPEALEQRRAAVARAGGSGVTAAPRELLRWCVGELLRSAAYDPAAPFVDPPLYPTEGRPGSSPRRSRTR
jgi:CheY-like chemotaxis protein